MKPRLIMLFLTIGALLMFNPCGFAENFKYENYASGDPRIDATLDYLSGWQHAEQKGSHGSFDQVIFYPPENTKGAQPAAIIVLTIENAAQDENTPDALESFVEDLIKKRMKFEEAKTLKKSKEKIAGREARDITLTYKRLKELYSIKRELITVKERLLIFQKGGRFYILRYENAEKEFNKFAKAFSHIAGTVKFKEQ